MFVDEGLERHAVSLRVQSYQSLILRLLSYLVQTLIDRSPLNGGYE